MKFSAEKEKKNLYELSIQSKLVSLQCVVRVWDCMRNFDNRFDCLSWIVEAQKLAHEQKANELDNEQTTNEPAWKVN